MTITAINLATDVWLPDGAELSGGSIVPSGGAGTAVDFILELPRLTDGNLALHISGLFNADYTGAYSVLSADEDGYFESNYYELLPYASGAVDGVAQTQDVLIAAGIGQYDEALTAGETYIYLIVDGGTVTPAVTSITWEPVTGEEHTLNVVPQVEFIYGTAGPSTLDPPSGTGNVWDADTGTFSYITSQFDRTTITPLTGVDYYTIAHGVIPDEAMEIIATYGIDDLTLMFTAKYDDDAGGTNPGAEPGFGILLSDSLNLAPTGATGADRHGFAVADNVMHSYTSNTWVLLNTTTLATIDQIAAALNDGYIDVAVPIIHSAGDFTTRGWIYALSFDLTYVTYTIPEPPPPPPVESAQQTRCHFARTRRS